MGKKSSKPNSTNSWSEAIRSMKFKETRYFLKGDESKNPYKFSHMAKLFNQPDKEFVSFYAIREGEYFILPLDEFQVQFYAEEVEL